MSPSLFFENQEFISSKEASVLTGYSRDYIGQLARNKKIDSKRIGRVLYVSKASLLGYKSLPAEIVPTASAIHVTAAGPAPQTEAVKSPYAGLAEKDPRPVPKNSSPVVSGIFLLMMAAFMSGIYFLQDLGGGKVPDPTMAEAEQLAANAFGAGIRKGIYDSVIDPLGQKIFGWLYADTYSIVLPGREEAQNDGFAVSPAPQVVIAPAANMDVTDAVRRFFSDPLPEEIAAQMRRLQSIPGPRGVQGLTGPQGPKGENADPSLFVSRSFFDLQISRLFDAIEDDDDDDDDNSGGSGVAAAGTLSGDTLAANVLYSSLTSVGTLTDLTVINPISGSITGSAATAAALAANGADCAAGSAPLGVDASGTAEGCTDYEEDLADSAGLSAALSDETGTGLAVFNDSPTLATPTVTTSAVIPLLIGGTGTTDDLVLRTTSGAGASGADMVFQVGNNGATEAMRILNSGFVGIGTAAPQYALEIHNNAGQSDMAITTNVNVGSANTTQLSFVSDLDGTPSFASLGQFNSGDLRFSGIGNLVAPDMVISATTGNVGIGATTPASLLDLRDADPVLTFSDTTAGSTQWQVRNGSAANGKFDIYDATNGESMLTFIPDASGGQMIIGSDSNQGGPGNASRLFVYGGQNGANIDVMGDGSIVGGDQAVIELQSSDYASSLKSMYMQYNGVNGIGTTMGFSNVHLGQLTFQDASTALIRTTNAIPIIFGTNNTEAMRLDENGNLDVVGTITASNFSGTLSGTNTGDVTLAGTPDYITIAGQVITRNKLDPADDLNAFASSVLSGLVTDEQGSGALVFADSPTFTTPNIGNATGNVSGNAGTATAFQTARTINGVSFDGTADITVAAAANTLTGNTLAVGVTSSSLTSVGALDSGSITSGFGSIDIGTDNITTTGTIFADTLTLTNTGTLNGLDALDAASESTIEAAIDALANLTSIQGQAVTFSGAADLSGTNTGDVTLAGTPDYITIAGQVITRNKLDPADDLNTFASSVLSGLITDEQGTGALVFADSPTLTTPALGAASATSLANTTFTTSAGAMSFTPDAGSGFNVNLSTTGDLAVNTDDLYVDTSAGNVGIGTTTPNDPLHIYETDGAGTQRTLLRLETADSTTGTGYNIDFAQGGVVAQRIAGVYESPGVVGLAFSTYGGGLSEKLRIAGTGNVGIGDTSPAALLTVGNGDLFQVNSSGAIAAVTGITSSGDITVPDEAYGASWDASTEVPTKNALYDKLETFAAGTGIDHGGLTGLTDDDHTQYTLLAGRSGGQTLIGGTDTTDDLVFRTTSGAGAAGSDMIFQVGNNGATEAVRILNSGEVGIGVASPESPLHVQTTSTSVANFLILEGDRNTADTEVGILFKDRTAVAGGQEVARIWVDRQGSAGNFDLVFQGGDQTLAGLQNESLRIQGDTGNVGINTSSPEAPLHISTTGTIGLLVEQIADSATNPAMVFRKTRGATKTALDGDLIGTFGAKFWDDTATPVETTGGLIYAVVDDASNGSEDASWHFTNIVGGTSTEIMSFQGGNVAIGNGITPVAKLHASLGTVTGIHTLLSATRAAAGTGLKVTNLSTSGTAGIWLGETDNTSDTPAGIVRFGSAHATRANDLEINTSGAGDIILSPFGNVGIGNSSPSAKLAVSADASATGLTAGQLHITGSTNTAQRTVIGYNTTSDYGWIEAGIQGTSFSNLVLVPNGGNVGIGDTTPAEGKLSIDTGATSGSGLSLIKTADARRNFLRWEQGTAHWQSGFRAAPYSWVLEYQSVSGNPADDTGWTSLITAETGGNVGIGIADPTVKLHVSGSDPHLLVDPTAGAGYVDINSVNGYSILRFQDNGSARWKIESDGSNDDLQFEEDDTTVRMVLEEGGNIGMGISDPTAPLHVQAAGIAGVKEAANFSATGNGGAGRGTGIIISAPGSTSAVDVVRLDGLQETASATANDAAFVINVANTSGSLTERLRIDSAGDVSIGTSTAKGRLNIFDTTQNTARIVLSGQEFYQAANTDTEGIAFLAGVNRTGNRQLWIGDSATLTQNSTNRVIRIMPNSGIIDSLATDGSTAKLLTLGNSGGVYMPGSVGIGDSSPTALFTVGNGDLFQVNSSGTIAAATGITSSGQIAFSGEAGANANDYLCIAATTGAISSKATACTGSSSLRYKKNIKNLELGLEAVMQMRPVEFDWKQEYIINPNAPRQIGFIAEEMAEISPLFVTYENGQVEAVEYMKLTSVLAKAIQELNLNLESVAVPLDFENNKSFSERFFGRLIAWFADATNGINSMFATTFEAKEKICVDGECLTKEDIRALLLLANSSSPGSSADDETPEPESDPVQNGEPSPEPSSGSSAEPEPDPAEQETDPTTEPATEDSPEQTPEPPAEPIQENPETITTEAESEPAPEESVSQPEPEPESVSEPAAEPEVAEEEPPAEVSLEPASSTVQ